MVSQVLLLSHPRTACHLLEKMLSKQDRCLYVWHPFVMGRPHQIKMLGDESIRAGIPDDIRQDYNAEIEKGNEQWRKALDDASSQDKILFLHSHPHFALTPDNALRVLEADGQSPSLGNFTSIPDELLLHPGTVPIFTTRHPAIILPSAFRLMRSVENSGSPGNLKIPFYMLWNRELYEWYTGHGITPLVVDTDDYTGPDHENVVRHLCAQSGLDSEQALFKWPLPTQEELDGMIPIYVTIQNTLLNSTGVQQGPTAESVNLTKIEAKARDEYGDEDAKFLMKMIEQAMPHYLFLRERRLLPPKSTARAMQNGIES